MPTLTATGWWCCGSAARIRASTDQPGFEEARRALAPVLAAATAEGLLSEPQFHLRSAAEAEQGGPLFLDLCHEGRILHDPDGWAARFLARYRERLAAQGSVRMPWGEGWYWRLTPQVRPAEEVCFDRRRTRARQTGQGTSAVRGVGAARGSAGVE